MIPKDFPERNTMPVAPPALVEPVEATIARIKEHNGMARMWQFDGGLSVVDVPISDMDALLGEVDRLSALLNTPETEDFIKAVPLEAAHQRERWGEQHDTEKSGAAWAFLFGVLAGKAIQAAKAGDQEKAKHHCITAAAAMANFHRLISIGHQPPEAQ